MIERLLPYRRAVLLAAHVVLMTAAYLLAFLLRFEFPLPPESLELFVKTLPVLLVIRMAVFAWFHLHHSLWRYVSMQDIVTILKAGTLSSLLFVGVMLTIFGRGFPRTVFLLDWVLCLALVGGVQLARRALRESSQRHRQVGALRALIVGAGDAGEMLVRETERNLALNYKIVGFVDDDRSKQHRRIHGIEVVGTIDQLPALSRSREIKELLIATPSASRDQQQRILQHCRESGVPFKSVPPLNELLQGKARIGQLEEVQPEDLLGRGAVRLDLDRLREALQGKRILVTGAAGSIGSELCRQLAAFEPKTLALFDRAESGLYFIDLELRRARPGLNVVPIVGDILDRRLVQKVIQDHAPELVYHTAAYKHVPLMEEHPLEGIVNNILGTETVATAAREGGVRKFVLISTDKAVGPVGIMGMTKRVAECLLLSLNVGPTAFLAVRFGNVLGSVGSVLPLFQWQIARGGPVTVTDPEATRYFMLISEAAQLVLQAGAMGKGGEVFFLDMGEPVKILGLAENLVQLSGLEPGKDIPIELIGLRPGERLNEALVREVEEVGPTEHEKILMVRNHCFDEDAFRQDLEALRCLVGAREREGAVAQLRAIASRY